MAPGVRARDVGVVVRRRGGARDRARPRARRGIARRATRDASRRDFGGSLASFVIRARTSRLPRTRAARVEPLFRATIARALA